MHIHKPKAAHSWREFGIELATIVLGILIALGLEQGIERIHEQRVAREAKAAVRIESERNLGLAVLRHQQRACLDHRLGEIDAILTRAQLHEAFERPRWVGRPRLLPLSESNWAAASQAGRISLFTAEEQSAYAEIYLRVGQLNELLAQEEMIWATLREMENPAPFTDLQLDRIRAARAQAAYIVWRIDFIADRMALAAKPLKLTPSKDLPYVSSIPHPSACLPIDTPRDKALRIIDNPAGEP